MHEKSMFQKKKYKTLCSTLSVVQAKGFGYTKKKKKIAGIVLWVRLRQV